nr:MAG TPA: hypothetical protein [Caudoviricetes sp.]DAZ73377.1 MAG TPA: hypothetical protein [Caudoviricetes sp.]
MIYLRGLCFKIKSNFTRAVERPSVYAAASWAWDQYRLCRTRSRIRLSDYCRPAPSAITYVQTLLGYALFIISPIKINIIEYIIYDIFD